MTGPWNRGKIGRLAMAGSEAAFSDFRRFPKKFGIGDRPPRTMGQNLRKGDRSDGERIGGP